MDQCKKLININEHNRSYTVLKFNEFIHHSVTAQSISHFLQSVRVITNEGKQTVKVKVRVVIVLDDWVQLPVFTVSL